MRKLLHIAVLGIAATFINVPTADAGRIGGPMLRTLMVPAFESVYLDIPFAAGETAAVTIQGDGQSIVHLRLYDDDGHVAIGNGTTYGPQTASMIVGRPGMFRVEVRNIADRPSLVRLGTN